MKIRKYFFIYSLLVLITNISCTNNREIILKEDCLGTIRSIYRDQNNHNVHVFNIESNGIERILISDFFPQSWEYAAIGDSIIKKKEDSFIIIKKKNGSSKIFETRVK